jgi:hypothetical protein
LKRPQNRALRHAGSYLKTYGECQNRKPEIVCWLSNCETSLYKRQRIHRSLIYAGAYYVGRHLKHLKDQNRQHQLDANRGQQESESREKSPDW